MGSLRGQGVVMSNYGLLLRDHVTLRCRSIDRIFLQAYVPRLQAVGDVCTFLRWQRRYPDSFISRLWQNWRRLCQGRVPFCRSPSYPGGSFQKGREERRHRAAASRRRGAARKGPRRAHRGGTREGVELEIVAAEGTGEGAPPAHGLGTRAGLGQSLLFLSLGCRMGRGVLENQRLRALSDLALAEWPRLGQTAVRESRHHLSGPGQRLSQLQRSRRFAADLRPPWSRRRARVLAAMAASALAV